MKVTVLGNNGPYPSAGGACSGYLLEDGGTRVLLDCGSGVLSNYLKLAGFDGLDAIILTHLHSDHISDMLVLRYAVQIKTKKGTMKGPIDVYATSEPAEEYARLDIKDAFNLRPVTAGLELNLGGMKLTFSEMTHPVKAHAIAVEKDGKRFVYSGDTSWNGNIQEFSKGADLLMLDAGLLAKDKTSDNVPHLTARECGIIARDSGAKKLLLTHFWPEYDVNDLLAEAREVFGNTGATKVLESYEV